MIVMLSLLCLLCLAAITRIVTVVVHELGHAVPAMLLTKQKVTIYIGSYGDPAKSFRIKVGLLEAWFKYNPLLWQGGLCVPSSKDISINRQIIYTLCGPIASIIIATTVCFLTFNYDWHGFLKLIFMIFFGSSIADLIINLRPNPTPIKLYDGIITYNDGYHLKQLFRYRRFPKEFEKAFGFYQIKNYLKACETCENFLSNGLEHEEIYRLAIVSFMRMKDYSKAQQLFTEFEKNYEPDYNDYNNAALIKVHLNLYDECWQYWTKSLELYPENATTLNNRGYHLTILKRYPEAITDLNLAISLNPQFAYAYNNRGFAKIKTGELEEGLHDIQKSIELDSNNSYAYRNLGIYYLEKDEKTKALELFKKARDLDSETPLLDELMEKAS